MTDRRILRLGKKIRTTRKEIGLSQEALVYESGLDRGYVGRIERGETNITVIKLLQISDALEVPMGKLVDF